MAKKQTTRRTSKSAAPKTKGPGVVASIIEVLSKATKTKPVTKEALLKQLVKRFPDRTPEAMTRTINCQLPSRLIKEKGLKIQSNDKNPRGYWIG